MTMECDLSKCEHVDNLERELKTATARWEYIKADTRGARAILLLLENGKGTPADFDTMVDRIIESRRIANT
jgi:hypothetical protein